MGDIKFKATSLEIKLRQLFKRTEEPQCLLSFGGIFTENNIRTEVGGFYVALISVLTQYYELSNSSKIDEFIEYIACIKNCKLQDIQEEKIDDIMDKLLSVIK